VTYNQFCIYENQCDSNLKCIKNKCSCVPNYKWQQQKSCQLDENAIKKLHNESCLKTEDCFIDAGLSCKNKTCSCSIGEYWSKLSGCSM